MRSYWLIVDRRSGVIVRRSHFGAKFREFHHCALRVSKPCWEAHRAGTSLSIALLSSANVNKWLESRL